MGPRQAMKDCVRYAPMIGAREGELSAEEAKSLAAHFAGCASCRAQEAAFRASDRLVSGALFAAANRRDFGPFVDGVMARIGARSRPEPLLARLRRTVSLHPRLAFGAAIAPVVAALAIVVYVRLDRHDEVARLFEMSSEGNVDMVLQTSEGPVVLFGADEDPEGS